MAWVRAILLLLVSWRITGYPQETPNTDPDRHIDGAEPSAPPPEEVLDALWWIRQNPYDLNEVTQEELEVLPGITTAVASEIVRFRKNRGGFTSVEQLLAFGEDVYNRLRPFVRVRPGGSGLPRSRRPVLTLRIRGQRDWSYPEDPDTKAFTGSMWKAYGRLIVQPFKDLQGGVLFKKDAGEPPAYSFASGYLALKNLGPVKQLLLGDFVVEAGQGVVLWRESGLGKGAEPVAVVKRSALGPQPYRYSGELAFFRGIAMTLAGRAAGGSLLGSVFYSRRSLAGAVNVAGELTSFHSSGLFRTRSEQSKTYALDETLAGCRITYAHPLGASIGISGYRTIFNPSIAGRDLHALSGSRATVAGLDARLAVGTAVVYGECAFSQPHGGAVLAGAVLTFSKNSGIGVVVRRYSPSFVGLHSHGFGEGAETRNEQGVYVGWNVRVTRWMRVSGYFDQFSAFWRSFSSRLPSRGSEVLIRTDIHPTHNTVVIMQWHNRQTERTRTTLDPLNRKALSIEKRSRMKTRLTVTTQVSKDFRTKARIEVVNVWWRGSPRCETGILLYQDVRWLLWGTFDLSGRCIYYQTDSYDSRVYEFERDVPGVLGFPPLYGKGIRWYVFLRIVLSRGLSTSLKYAHARRHPSMPAEEHADPTVQRLSLQLDIRL